MWADVAVIAIKLAFGLAVLLTTVPIMVWVERRGSALIQDRLGPNRVGPFGLFQPVIDVIKLITKENIMPSRALRGLFLLAPLLAVSIALSTFVAMPIGADSGLELFGHTVDGLIVAPDLNIGILYIFAIASLGVYPLVLAGLGVGQQVRALRRHSGFGPGYLVRTRNDPGGGRSFDGGRFAPPPGDGCSAGAAPGSPSSPTGTS